MQPEEPDNLSELLAAGSSAPGYDQPDQPGADDVMKRAAARRRGKRTKNILLAIFVPMIVLVGGYIILVVTGVLGGSSQEWRPPAPGEGGLPAVPIIDVQKINPVQWRPVNKKLTVPDSGVIGYQGLEVFPAKVQRWSEKGRGLVYIAMRSTDGQVYSSVQLRVTLLDFDDTAYQEAVIDVPIVGPEKNTNAYLPFDLPEDKPTDFRLVEVLGATVAPNAVMVRPVPFGVVVYRRDYEGRTPIEARMKNRSMQTVGDLRLVADVMLDDNWPISTWQGRATDVVFAPDAVEPIEIQPTLPSGVNPEKANIRAYATPVSAVAE